MLDLLVVLRLVLLARTGLEGTAAGMAGIPAHGIARQNALWGSWLSRQSSQITSAQWQLPMHGCASGRTGLKRKSRPVTAATRADAVQLGEQLTDGFAPGTVPPRVATVSSCIVGDSVMR